MLKKLVILLTFAFIFSLSAEDKIYFVTKEKDAGKAAAEKAGGKWAKSLTKAFAWAGRDFEEKKETNVIIKVAQGEYSGDLGSGAYQMPLYDNPKESLKIEGGYNKDFTARKPFATPSKIVTIKERSAVLISFTKKSKLKSFVMDGIIMDAQNSNNYDSKSNSLLKRGSSTWGYLSFQYLETDHLGFNNCVFMNAAHTVMAPLIRAATPNCTIKYYNCIFLNNVIPIKLEAAGFRNMPKNITVDHCSFLLNWALNPDPNTGNPAALEIGNKYGAKEIIITNNLFYANFGGAIMALSKFPPPMTVNNNNFVGNGLLHGQTASEAVAMIVSAGGRKQPIDIDTIEDVTFIDEAEDNVSIPPGIPLSLGKAKPIDINEVKVKEGWENQVRGILGLNLQGTSVKVSDYAPKKDYDPTKPPFATDEKAKKYGASAALVK